MNYQKQIGLKMFRVWYLKRDAPILWIDGKVFNADAGISFGRARLMFRWNHSSSVAEEVQMERGAASKS